MTCPGSSRMTAGYEHCQNEKDNPRDPEQDGQRGFSADITIKNVLDILVDNDETGSEIRHVVAEQCPLYTGSQPVPDDINIQGNEKEEPRDDLRDIEPVHGIQDSVLYERNIEPDGIRYGNKKFMDFHHQNIVVHPVFPYRYPGTSSGTSTTRIPEWPVLRQES